MNAWRRIVIQASVLGVYMLIRGLIGDGWRAFWVCFMLGAISFAVASEP